MASPGIPGHSTSGVVPPVGMPSVQQRPSIAAIPGRVPGIPGTKPGYPATAPQSPQQSSISVPTISGLSHVGIPGPMRSPMGVASPTSLSMGYTNTRSVGIPNRTVLDGFARQRSPSAGTTVGSVSPSIPRPQVATTLEKLHISSIPSSRPIDSAAIVKRFDMLVGMIKERAAGKNSLIIKQRKNQHLGVLAIYDTINKPVIPVGALEVMDALRLRMENVDSTLKSDVDTIVSRQNDYVWLRAFAKLVKLLY